VTEEAIVSLPEHNPIDTGWFRKGVPIDHLGVVRRKCDCCGQITSQEHFKVVAGSKIGFGAPVFIQPFMKRQSTRGKIGGVRGAIFQCTECDSLWPDGPKGEELLSAADFPTAGVVSLKFAADFEKRKARELEERLNRRSDPSPSKVRKLPR